MATRRTSIALYRTLLRAGRSVRLSEEGCVVFTPAITELNRLAVYSLRDVDAMKWRSYGLDGLIIKEVDGDQNLSRKAILTGEDIEKLVRMNFKNAQPQALNNEDSIDNSLDLGFKGVSGLSQLSRQSARSSVHTTSKGDNVSVRIFVTASLHTQQSTSEYNYCYRVQVENIGQSAVQLCGRHWTFCNERGEEESVVPKYAQGVVGETPIMLPGEGMQYMSQCFLSTSAGCMRGAFLFSDLDNEELFEAEIGRCKLLSY